MKEAIFNARLPRSAVAEAGMLCTRIMIKESIMEEDAGRDAKMLEFAMVVLVYD